MSRATSTISTESPIRSSTGCATTSTTRGSGRAVIVFTQFTDTLNRSAIASTPYRSHLATYTGDGGRLWIEDEGWVHVSKQELVEALRSGRVSVILATDAASEGLNLQAASYLISYDLPWNLMPRRATHRPDRPHRPTRARSEGSELRRARHRGGVRL